jgi:hypothetical protein
MKTTHHNKLAFAKNDLVELNNSQMIDVKGGTSPLILTTLFTVTSTTTLLADQAVN